MLSISAVTSVDGIYVGHGIGSNGIAAINICMPVLMIFTGADGTVARGVRTSCPMVVEYMKWFVPSLLFQMWCSVLLFVIRLDGSPRMAMLCNVMAAAITVILGYVFIFILNLAFIGYFQSLERVLIPSFILLPQAVGSPRHLARAVPVRDADGNNRRVLFRMVKEGTDAHSRLMLKHCYIIH